MNFRLKPTGTGLASRQAAAVARALIEEKLSAGVSVELDLSSVRSISSSYADELFGVLAERYSLEDIALSIKLSEPSPHVLRQIATAIQYRLDRGASPGSVSALAATRALESRACRESA